MRAKRQNKKQKSYGQLSKQDKQFLKEYGQSKSDLFQQEQELKYTQRTMDESELDALDKRDLKKIKTEVEEEVEEEEEWDKPSAYEMLLNDLKVKSRDFSDSESEDSEAKEVSEIEDHEEEEEEELFESESEEEYEDFEEEEVEQEGFVGSDNEEVKEDFEDQFNDEEEVNEEPEEEEESGISFYQQQFCQFDTDSEALKKLTKEPLQSQSLQHPFFGQLQIQKQKPFDLNQLEIQLKPSLKDKWEQSNPNQFQNSLLEMISNYQDLFYIDDKLLDNSFDILNTFAIHSLNHVLKTRARIMKNSELLKKQPDMEPPRDQGFTRPKILVLLPFRHTAKVLVEQLMKYSTTIQQENKKKFKTEFSLQEGEEEMDQTKPKDYQKIFEGNIDDCFRLGIKISRKSMRLYTEFYNSDVIVASPLGLRMVIGSKGDKKRDFDFLSSIEMVLVHQCDVLNMQNWDHVQHIFQHLNLLPKEMRETTDFSRVKFSYLDNQAQFMRQTIMTSSLLTPNMNTLWNKSCQNIIGGKIKLKPKYKGSILDCEKSVQKLFAKIIVESYLNADDERFEYFKTKTMPQFQESAVMQSHICIFIPQYADFLRIRNWFEEKELNFGAISEYTSNSEISRARSNFYHGKIQYLLITERFHFFRRYKIRNIEHLLFYSPPVEPFFYAEFVNMLKDELSVVVCLFHKYDAMALERIIGTKRLMKIMQSDQQVFMLSN